MRFVLASSSPARLETLRRAGIEPDVIVSGVDETGVRARYASDLVARLAELKASTATQLIDGPALVLGCDSLLEMDGSVMGKPSDASHARQRWRAMRGRTGILHTGHALVETGGRSLVKTASTTVRFSDVTDDEIDTYCATDEPLRVAGAFTIDGLGGWFVESVDGDHHNVIGLSLPLLRRMLIDLGYRLGDVGYPVSRR